MFRIAGLLSVAAIAPVILVSTLGGCVITGAPEPTPPQPIRIVLFNSTKFDVRPNFHTSGSATDAAGLFVASKLRTDFTDRAFPELRPHETATLTLECDDVQSLGSDAPVFFDAAQVIATTSEDRVFLTKGTNLSCGDTLRFVYFSEAGVFHVRVDEQ